MRIQYRHLYPVTSHGLQVLLRGFLTTTARFRE